MNKMGKRRTEEDIRNLYQGYVDIKQSFQDFAKKEKVDKDILRRDFTSLNLPLHPHGDLKLKLSEEKAKEIHSLYLGGQSIDEVAALVSIDRSSILRTFKRLSLSLKDVKQQKLEKRERTLKTTKERYGVDNVAQTTESRLKVSKAWKETVDIEAVSLKRKNTCLTRYGVSNPVFDKEIEQRRQQSLAKVDYQEALRKRKAFSLNKYGLEHTTQVPEIKNKIIGKQLSRRFSRILPLLKEAGYTLLDAYEGKTYQEEGKHLGYRQYRIMHICGTEFTDDVFLLPRCPKCFPLNVSIAEKELSKYLSSKGEEVRSSRDVILNPSTNRYLELDCYLPKRAIAFEFNSVYRHNGMVKDRLYHKLKSDLCLAKGIKLFHIWDFFPSDIVQSKLDVILGIAPNSIGARECKVKELDYYSTKEFLDRNHIHGSCPFEKSFGLFNNERLVAVFVLRNKLSEVARFCTTQGLLVHGGFSKLFSHVQTYLKDEGKEKLFTYVDRDLSPEWKDTVYFKQGFKFLGDTGPRLVFAGKNGKIYARQALQKHKLQTLFPKHFDPALTALEILYRAGVVPLWTSGNWKLEFSLLR